MTARLVVFTANLGYSVRAGVAAIAESLPEASWLVVVHAPRKSPAVLLRNQWRNLKRNGWRWIPHVTGEAVRRLVARGGQSHAAASTGPDATFDALAARGALEIVSVADIHDERTLAIVRAFAPDLGLSLAAPILDPALFALPRLGTLNLHKGRVPAYRGMPPAFWELWNDEREVGCTVHRVDAQLDAGDIVAETTVPREPHATLRGLQLALDERGITLMREAVLQTLAGTARPVRQPQGGHTYRKPTLAQHAELTRRLRTPQPGGSSAARRSAKEIAFAAYIALWYAVLRWTAPPRVTVLLYHRVTDDARDNLAVGVEQFDRQVAMLRERCEVVSIDTVASAGTIGRSRKPLVCVTFDDGYLDNYTNAVPILRRHGVPAAFFVATGIVDSPRPFPHDVLRGSGRPPVMSWDDLRAIVKAGFVVGSHSVSHIDCAREPEEVVRRELAQSRDDLRRELGVERPLFAYPYGGREHMTPERLKLVKEAGYAGCLSAYGGTNVRRIDPFDIRREAIHWGFSDRAFFVRCLGQR